MTEKYRKIVNKPVDALKKARKKIENKVAKTKSQKALKGSALIGVGLAEFMARFAKVVALDNKLMRKLEKKLSEINVGKDKDGYDRKFQSFVKRNPNLSAVAIWWAMLGMLIGGVSIGSNKKSEKDKPDQKKEIIENKQPDEIIDNNTIEYAVVSDMAQEKLDELVLMSDSDLVRAAIKDNLPYIDVVLFASENYRTDWYSDAGPDGKKNTLGVGLYYIPSPQNAYDFTSTKWVRASSAYDNYPRAQGKKTPRALTDDEVYEGIEGWFFNMGGNGAVRVICRAFAGSDIVLTQRDLTVISSVLFNSVDCCKRFCNFIKKHPDDRVAWAKFLLRVDDVVSPNRLKKYPGLKARRVHEILLLLDVDNYCQDVFGVQIDGKRSGALSYGKKYFNRLSRDFSMETLIEAKKAICDNDIPNGKTICEFVQRSEKYRDVVFEYCPNVDEFLRGDEPQELYADNIQSVEAPIKVSKTKKFDSAKQKVQEKTDAQKLRTSRFAKILFGKNNA